MAATLMVPNQPFFIGSLPAADKNFIPGIFRPNPGTARSRPPHLVLTNLLGEGAYGKVYEAKIGNASVALKVNIIANNILGARSLRELDILRKCQAHPHIVRFLAVYFDKPFEEIISLDPKFIVDPMYMVMEFSRRGNLGQYIETRYTRSFGPNARVFYNPFSEDELLEISFQMLVALEFTHGLGVIHRDLKLSNFVVSMEPGDRYPTIRLVDFGTSRAATSQGAMSPVVMTYPYRAPEVCIQVEQYGKVVDSWSLGCIFYELVTGERFVNVSSDADVLILSEIYRIHPDPMPMERLRQLATPGSAALSCFNNKPRRTWEEMLRGCPIGYAEMIKGLMKMDPAERWTIKQALECPYWAPWQTRLGEVRKAYPVGRPPFVYTVSETNYDYCQILLNSFSEIVQQIHHKKWFNISSAFITINLIYRLTAGLQEVKSLIPSARFHTYILIYMVVKYQICLSDPPPWHDVAPGIYNREVDRAELVRLERIFLETVELQVYATTPYDVCRKKLSHEENNILLRFMTENPSRLNGLTPEQVVELALGSRAIGS